MEADPIPQAAAARGFEPCFAAPVFQPAGQADIRRRFAAKPFGGEHLLIPERKP